MQPTAVKLTFKQRILQAGGWSIGGQVVSQLIRLGSNLLLTRLLVPEAFGLMAVTYVLIVGLALFSDIGIGQNVIRSVRGQDQMFLNTAWSLQIVRGFFIYCLTLLAALGLAAAAAFGWLPDRSVYADPALPWVVAVASLAVILQGFDSTKIPLARRQMQLRKITEIEIVSQLVALVVTAGLAWAFRSVWALVVGGLVAAAVRCLMSHLTLPGPGNQIAWDRSALSELLGFGKWVFLSSIIGYGVISGDRIMLGGVLDTAVFGLYAIAFLLASALHTVNSTLASSVAYPALSQVARERPNDLKAVTNKFQRLADLVLVTGAGILITAGTSLIDLLYDSRYQQAGPMLSMLAVGAIGARYVVVEQAYMALGKPNVLVITNLLRLIVLYAGIPIGNHYFGLDGALIAIVLSQFSGWPVALYFKIRFQLFSLGAEVFALIPLLLGLTIGYAFAAVLHAARQSL